MITSLLMIAAGIELRLEAPSRRGEPGGGPLRLRFAVENTGDSAQTVRLPVDWGHVVAYTPPGGEEHFRMIEYETTEVTLAPGAFVGRTVDVGPSLSLTEEGFYTFRFRLGESVSNDVEIYIVGQYYAEIEIANYGTVTIEFTPDVAPRHVESFLELARDGFYDGLTFHRIIRGFMMQGGCPRGNGSGNAPDNRRLPAEFNETEHEFGTLSMARTNDPNSASCQFFICFGRAEHLDHQYSAFGRVIAGGDVVRAIERVPTGAQDRPQTEVRMTRVRVIPAAEWAGTPDPEGR